MAPPPAAQTATARRLRLQLPLLASVLSLASGGKASTAHCRGGAEQLVIARYQEDISWSDEFAAVRLVYEKGPKEDAWPGAATAPSVSKRLINEGRDVHTLLYHLETCYKKLANWTVFFQGRWDDQGFPGIVPSDFLEVGRSGDLLSFLPISTELYGLKGYRARLGYQEGLGGLLGRLKRFDDPELREQNRRNLRDFADWSKREELWSSTKDYNRTGLHGEWLIPAKDGYLKLEHRERGEVGLPWLGRGVEDQRNRIDAFWREYVCPNDPRHALPPKHVYITNGMFCGLTPAVVHRRPRSFYRKLRELLEPRHGREPREAKLLAELIHTFWRYVLGEGDPCEKPVRYHDKGSGEL